jgi:hypothetical protein
LSYAELEESEGRALGRRYASPRFDSHAEETHRAEIF